MLTRRLAAALAAALVVFVAGFYLGPGMIDRVVAWAGPTFAAWPLIPSVLTFLDDRDPVEIAFALAGLVFGAPWLIRPRNPRGERIVFGSIPKEAKWFQRRPVEQEALENALGAKGKAALVALPGARGAGKSQLAAAYTRKCIKQGYELVAWINAESGPVPDLAALGDLLGLRTRDDLPAEQVAAAVVEKLDASPHRWLLVLDNVEDPDDIVAFLPDNGKVLITTNRREVITMAGVTTVDIGMFTPAQGRAFLAVATGQPDTAAAARLGKLLGWLPLGLAQAAAYLRLNQLSYRQYADRLSRVNIDDVLQRFAGAQHRGVLAATRLSMDALDRDDPSGNARRLLNVLSLLAPEGIGRALLAQPGAAAALGMDQAGVERALGVLANGSLILQANPGGESSAGDPVLIAVHRLTAKVVRHYAASPPGETLDTAVAAAAKMLEAIGETVPIWQAARRRAEVEHLVAHIGSVRSHSARFSKALNNGCAWAASVLAEVGDSARSIELQEGVVAEHEQALGADHPDTLYLRRELGYFYARAGRYREASAICERNLADHERVLGSDHRYTLTARHHLADTLRRVGRLEEAVALAERNVAGNERVNGPEHFNTLTARNVLSLCYSEAGRHEEALALDERNLADRERLFGPDDRHTLPMRHNLGIGYGKLGRDQEAMALLERASTGFERTFGPEHPDTIEARNSLATAYLRAGHHHDAITLFERSLADRERILGPDHPDTIRSRRNVGVAYETAEQERDATPPP